MQLLCWQICFGQVDPWERVKLIEQGENVSVKLQSGKTLNGKMEAWSSEGITVRQGKDKMVAVAKSDAAQVAIVTGMSRERKAAWALLGVGGSMGVLATAACASLHCDAPPAAVGALNGAMYGGGAAAIAALFPPHKEVIYTAAAAPGDSVRR